MTWCGLQIKENHHILVNQFHGNFRSKTLSCRKIKYIFRDVKWCFNASWGLKGLKRVAGKNNKWHCILSITTLCRATYKFSQKKVTAYFSSSYFLLSLESWAEVCEYHRMVIWPLVTWPLDHAIWPFFFVGHSFPWESKGSSRRDIYCGLNG